MPKAMLISMHGDPLARLGGVQSGGQNVYVRQVALGLQRLGWEVDVFSHWQDPAAQHQEKLGPRGRVVRLAAGRREFIPKDELYHYVPAFAAELKDYVKRDNGYYDIIHSNYWLSGLAGLSLKEYLGIPQVHTFHSLGSVKARETKRDGLHLLRRLEAEKKIVQTVDCLVATAPEERASLIRDYGAHSERIVLIPCGVDPELFHPGDRRASKAALGLAGKRVALYVGRHEENKGLRTLLAALEVLVKDDPRCARDVRVLIVGGDVRDKERLDEELLARGLAGWVAAVGPKPQEELALYYRAAEVCVVPSYYETFGLVAVEAMACATPVIASRVGGLKFTVVDGVTGYLVPPRDPGALAARLAEVLGYPSLALRLGQAAARRVQHLFTWPRVVEGLSSLYDEVRKCNQSRKMISSSF